MSIFDFVRFRQHKINHSINAMTDFHHDYYNKQIQNQNIVLGAVIMSVVKREILGFYLTH